VRVYVCACECVCVPAAFGDLCRSACSDVLEGNFKRLLVLGMK